MDEINRRVATSLRRLRREKGFTLEELARRSGVSRAMLSQIESTKVNPTIAVVWKISAGLGVSFADLLGPEAQATVEVLRVAEARYLWSQDKTFRSRPLVTNVPGHKVELYEIWLAPRAGHPAEPHPPGSHEFLSVLTGRCRLEVAGEPYALDEGDGIVFLADRPHHYQNPAPKEFLGHSLILYGGK
ncbi:MAG TPA: XRE family transcriptional regulator [Polyangia bacterium]|jgi:transcriptional regulator with XRE-family HTH domain